MKAVLKRILILFCVFVAGVIFFAYLLNRKEVVRTEAMGSPKLPLMYMVSGGEVINQMSGYRTALTERTERESLTLLPMDRQLTLQMKPFEQKVSELRYQVTSLLDGSLVENGKVKNLMESNGILSANIRVDQPLLMNQEYMLCFEADLSGSTVYYYTRILQRANVNLSQYIAFARGFTETCLQKERAGELKGYMESDATAANSSYHLLDIRSSLDKVTWGDMAPVMENKAVPTLVEANDTTCSLRLDYVISMVDEESVKRYYSVSDFYRMRCQQDTVVLLDFNRRTDELFDGEHVQVKSSGISLGIVGKDLKYRTNQSATAAAFVVQGELWSYHRDANKLSRVFGFRDPETLDARTENQNHGIQISKVGENGDLTFVVYGYFSAGDHEGETGIAAYEYSEERNVCEEKVFIPVNKSFAIMEQSLSKLAYINENDQLYFYLDRSIYQIDLAEGVGKVLQEGIRDDCFVVSNSMQSCAWMNEMQDYSSTNVTMLNMKDGSRNQIQASQGEYIRTLGFINEDLVYGLARQTDVVTDTAGNVTFGMYCVRIGNFAGGVEKEYRQDGIYIIDVVRNEDYLELQQAYRNEYGFIPAGTDHILNRTDEGENSIALDLSVDDKKGTQISFEFTVRGSSNILVLKSQFLARTDPLIINLPVVEETENNYYVYGLGKLQGRFSHSNKAIQKADELVGVVLDEKQRYIWERGNVNDTAMIPIENIPAGVVTAELDENQLQGLLGDAYTVMNLTGCSLESIYYQIGHGYPVIGRFGDGQALTLVGYDRFNVWAYDRATGQVYAIASDDATAQAAVFGNAFLSYIPR